MCVTVTAVTVPFLLGAGSGTDDPAVEVIADATVVEEKTEATALLQEADAEELFDAGAQDDALPVSGALSAVGVDSQEWPTIAVSRSAGSLNKDAEGSSSAAQPATSQSSTTQSSTTQPSTTQPPVTHAPTTRPPATQAPTTQAPATQPPASEATTTQAPTTQGDTSGEPTAAQWEALRQCEAWGDYTVVSGNGLYYGAYQFAISTWDGLAGRIGRADLVGVLPNNASPADQDTMALELWREQGWTPWPTCKVAAIAAG